MVISAAKSNEAPMHTEYPSGIDELRRVHKAVGIEMKKINSGKAKIRKLQDVVREP